MESNGHERKSYKPIRCHSHQRKSTRRLAKKKKYACIIYQRKRGNTDQQLIFGIANQHTPRFRTNNASWRDTWTNFYSVIYTRTGIGLLRKEVMEVLDKGEKRPFEVYVDRGVLRRITPCSKRYVVPVSIENVSYSWCAIQMQRDTQESRRFITPRGSLILVLASYWIVTTKSSTFRNAHVGW